MKEKSFINFNTSPEKIDRFAEERLTPVVDQV